MAAVQRGMKWLSQTSLAGDVEVGGAFSGSRRAFCAFPRALLLLSVLFLAGGRVRSAYRITSAQSPRSRRGNDAASDACQGTATDVEGFHIRPRERLPGGGGRSSGEPGRVTGCSFPERHEATGRNRHRSPWGHTRRRDEPAPCLVASSSHGVYTPMGPREQYRDPHSNLAPAPPFLSSPHTTDRARRACPPMGKHGAPPPRV